MFGPASASSSSSSSLKHESPSNEDDGKWFCKEDWVSRVSGGRVVFQSRVWTPEGTHAATAMQDGMMRLAKKATPTVEEERRVREVEGRWKRSEKL